MVPGGPAARGRLPGLAAWIGPAAGPQGKGAWGQREGLLAMGRPLSGDGLGRPAPLAGLPHWLEPLAGLGCWTIGLAPERPLVAQSIAFSAHALELLGRQGKPPGTVADLVALCADADQATLLAQLGHLVNAGPGRPQRWCCRWAEPAHLDWLCFAAELQHGAEFPLLVGTLRPGGGAAAGPGSPGQAAAGPSGPPLGPGTRDMELDRHQAQALLDLRTVQDAHAQDQALWQVAMDTAPIGMALWDPEAECFDQVNPALCLFLGRSQPELMASSWQALTHPDDRAAEEALARELGLGRLQSYRLRKRFVRPDGVVVWGDLSVAAIRHGNGRLRLLLKQVIDLSEWVQLQAQLKDQHLQLRTTLDSLLDPHLLLDVVRDGLGVAIDFRLADANGTALHVLRSTREKVLGASLPKILPGLDPSPLMTLLRDVADHGGYRLLDDLADPTDRLVPGQGYLEVRVIRVHGALSLTWRDVTERHQMIQRMASSEQQHRLLTENASDVVMLLRRGLIEWISPVLDRMLGWSPGHWMGHRLEQFVHPEDLALARHCCMEDGLGPSRVTRLRLRDRAGQHHWVEAHSSSVASDAGLAPAIVASFRTVDREVASEAALERRARYDDLTGLVNRSEMLERFCRVLNARRGPMSMAVLFIDIDAFKSINDRHGHAGGDRVLKTVAERIHRTIRKRDWAARIGGDEMLVVLSGLTDLAKAMAIAETMRAAVQIPIAFGPEQIAVSISVGVTLASSEDSVEALIARADHAMYQAKQQGRDQVIAIPAQDPQPE